MNCPKCDFEQEDLNAECVKCGIVFAKFKQPEVSEPVENESGHFMQEQQDITSNPLITAGIKSDLQATKPWVKFISILLFISIGFMIIAMIGMLVAKPPMPGAGAGIAMIGMAVMYGLMGVLYFFPARYLYRYSSSIGEMLENNSVGSLETAIGHQKSFWKFTGWATLVSCVITMLGIIAAIVIPMIVGLSQ